MYFEHKRRLLAGILLSAALLSGCITSRLLLRGAEAPEPMSPAPVGSGSASVPTPPDGEQCLWERHGRWIPGPGSVRERRGCGL